MLSSGEDLNWVVVFMLPTFSVNNIYFLKMLKENV